jgi:hypothetical protein
MAKSISVAVGESETIRSGLFTIRTSPFAAFTERGKGDCRGLEVDVGADPPWLVGDAHAEARRIEATSTCPRVKITR